MIYFNDVNLETAGEIPVGHRSCSAPWVMQVLDVKVVIMPKECKNGVLALTQEATAGLCSRV